MSSILRKSFSIEEKLNILSQSSIYDIVCSTSKRLRNSKSIKIGDNMWIYRLASSSGKHLPVLKLLMTNYCIYDCAFCINRRSNDIPRTFLSPKEIVELTLSLYKKGIIAGLFLSSGVYKSPDYTTELLIYTAYLLRKRYGFKGYIHLKIMPGTSEELIKKASFYSTRLSINLEFSTDRAIKLLTPQKTKDRILKPMRYIKENSSVKAGQTTQVIIGGSDETDFEILKNSNFLYKNIGLKRVYYSAYIPINEDERLPKIDSPPFLREHRLYQADWLMREYGYSLEEILKEDKPFLELELDPKLKWALDNIDFFPVELTKASYEELLRIPGIGVKGAKKVVELRKKEVLNVEGLQRLGINLKRAKFFFTLKGRYIASPKKFTPEYIRSKFSTKQLELFSNNKESIIFSIPNEKNIDFFIDFEEI